MVANIEQLIDVIRQCEGRDILCLATALLRFCREHLAELDDAYNRRHVNTNAFALEAKDLFGEHGDEVLDSSLLENLSTLLGTIATHCDSAVVAARIVAEGLEACFGRRIAECFYGRGPITPGPGEPFPVVRHPVKKIFDRRLNTDPGKVISRRLDALSCIRLAPADLTPYTLRFEWIQPGLFATLEGGTTIGVAIPNRDVTEFAKDAFDRDGRPLFFNVRPRETDRQRDTILRLLDEAEAHNVALLVMPELCVTPTIMASLREWWFRQPRKMLVFVAGSAHVETDDGRRNRSATLLSDGKELPHFKFAEFFFDEIAPGGNIIQRFEDIETRPATIRVFIEGDWFFTTLICKDAMDPQVKALLAELQIRLVFLPACSPKTQIFDVTARSLSVDSQAVVIVANTLPAQEREPAPEAQRPQAAVFSQPMLGDGILRDGRPLADELPALFTLRLGEEDIRCYSVFG